MLVGIDDFVVRGDLRDRSVFLHLPAIPRTQTAHGAVVLAGVSGGLSADLGRRARRDRGRPGRAAVGQSEGAAAHGRLRRVGRSDRPGPGVGSDAFLSTYNDNRKAATEALLEDSSVATVRARARPDGSQLVGHAAGAL